MFCVIFQDAFIGFGGNIVREKVQLLSPWFVKDFQVLLDQLQAQSDNGPEQS